ncbi:MAG TPA: HD domain-containing protein [Thermodesulfobacteriota bacterium]|nr:HD domain-containing protein [Thermodesulfobacteriota bacterium]
MEKILVSQITKGQSLESVFLVKEKSLNKTKSGSPYLSIRLCDRTGEIEARIWDNAIEFVPLFEKDDFIRVKAETDEFQGVLQLRISKLKRCAEAEIRLEDFLPKTSKDIPEMFAELKRIASSVENPFLQKLLDSFFRDEAWAARFAAAPAAKGVHHVYLGGVLEHTLCVARLVSIVAPLYPGLNRDLLLAGAILHDTGKIAELSFERAFDYTDRGRLLGHIILSVEMVEDRMRTIPGFPGELALLLKHLLLSHHGEYEFGSPKLPMTVEAMLLHQLDDLDAKVNAFSAWMEKEKDAGGRWTSYFKLFDRFLYKPK